MDERLTKEEVLHVAKLAKIKLSEEELEKYQIDLKKLLNEVEKINEVESYDDNIMIAPWDDNTVLRKDIEGNMLNKDDMLKNVPKHVGNYVEVPAVIGEGGA